MDERYYEIFDFLPLEPASLGPYIDHLWGAFLALIEKEHPVKPFAILPFHLLCMFAIQYKVFRISAFHAEDYLTTLGSCSVRKPNDLEMLRQNPPIRDNGGVIPSHCLVSNLSYIPEGKLFDFLKIINVDSEVVEKGKELVKIRSTYAHANGNIEENIESRIEQYFSILRLIQPKMLKLNDSVAERWLEEMGMEEDGEYYISQHLSEEYLCPADMQQGKLSKLDDRLNGKI
ncbi:MAG: hypothetical protein KBC15_01755 [Candidatus Levybacteria bacterium]|nr:hypothetical protein [Candidatus Levybacteria bacterium]